MKNKVTKYRYIQELKARLFCTHCRAPNAILHHPDCDGHLGRIGDIPADAPNLIARLDAEVARCVPLCRSCHSKEHERLRAAAGWRRVYKPGGGFSGWGWQRTTEAACP
jgi:hypothetical protein